MDKNKESCFPQIPAFLKTAVGFVLLFCAIVVAFLFATAIATLLFWFFVRFVKHVQQENFPWVFAKYLIPRDFANHAIVPSVCVFALVLFKEQVKALISSVASLLSRIQTLRLGMLVIETASNKDREEDYRKEADFPQTEQSSTPPTKSPWKVYRQIEKAALMLLGNELNIHFQQGARIKGFSNTVFDGVGIEENTLYIVEVKDAHGSVHESGVIRVCEEVKRGLHTLGSSFKVKFIVGVVGDNEDIMNAAFKSRVSEMCSPDIDVEFHFLKRNKVETIAKYLEDR